MLTSKSITILIQTREHFGFEARGKKVQVTLALGTDTKQTNIMNKLEFINKLYDISYIVYVQDSTNEK